MAKSHDDRKKPSAAKLARTVAKSTRMIFRANPFGASFITLANVVEAIIPSFTALFLGLMINEVTGGNFDGFVFFIVLTFALAVIQTVLTYVSRYFNWVMQYDIENHALEQLYLKVTKIPIAVREMKENSDKLEIAEGYGLSLGWLFPNIVQTVSQVVAFVTAFVVLANVSLIIALVTLVVLIPDIISTTYRMNKEREFWKSNSVNRRRGTGYRWQLTDQKLAMELKLYGLSHYFIKRWRHYITRDRQQNMAVNKKLLPLEASMGIANRLTQFGVLLWSGKRVIDGAMEVGFLVTIKGLMDNLSSAGSSLAISINQVGREMLDAGDYFDYLELPEEKTGDVVLKKSDRPPKIEFRDVVFTYPMNEEPTIKKVSFTIESGEDIALVGENGSGKTTIVKLLLGVYQPDSGRILIDDIPIERLDKDAYYKLLGALFQDYARYEFTDLADNIWYGDITKKAERGGLLAAIEKAKLGPLLKKLPHGFSQILSKRFDEKNGTDLSGGQWQRVALARGFWRGSNILILDEPTSSVDAKAEYEIFGEIAKAQSDKTTIIISHRFSTVRKAQKIFVIDDGKVIESGTHRELMKINDGLYREMFTLQAEGYLN
jgi:ATP-binding cassette subfamily B protein